MPYFIEVVSVGGDFDRDIREAAQVLNGSQNEFIFDAPPERLRTAGASLIEPSFATTTLYEFLRRYRSEARGQRPFLIAIVDKELHSTTTGNLFGSHEAAEGLAVVTLHDHHRFVESTRLYLTYYFIRYALSFVAPGLRSHDETRACFFDFKRRKADIVQSIDSGAFCDGCRAILWKELNPEGVAAVLKMASAMKSLRSESQASFAASALRGQVDVAIIAMREDDEYPAVLSRLSSWRHVVGSGSNYSYTQVRTRREEVLRVVVARTPAQGPGVAQAIASSIIADVRPSWILLVGIAGGIPSTDYSLGDILLSQRLHDFSVSAALEGKPPEFENMGGPMELDVEKAITDLRSRLPLLGDWNSKESIGREKPVEIAPASISDPRLYGDESWRNSVIKSLQTAFPQNQPARPPRFRSASIVSSGTLVKSTELARQWQQTARHASAVEMELTGVWLAARYADQGTRVLAIRGLSDVIGYSRDPAWTEYAAYSAASFMHAFITSGIVSRPPTA